MVDDRSPSAKAMSVVSQIMTIAVIAVLPMMGGFWVDQWLNTKPLFILIGGAFGFFAAGYQLTRLVKHLNKSNSNP